MKRILAMVLATISVSACTADSLSNNDPSRTASQFLGLQERQDRQELKELTGVDPVRTEWCAAFVNAILEIDRIPNLHDIDYPYPLTARGFLRWGTEVPKEEIRRGDLVIFPRGTQGWQGHVGFYVETRIINGRERWIILGGNQDQSVSYKYYSPSSAIGIRRYEGSRL